MKVKQFKVMAPVGSTIQKIDGIEYKGKLWLVPSWLDYHKEKFSKPERMIRFDNLEFAPSQGGEFQFVLSRQLPQNVLDGEITEGYEILLGNDIDFAIPFAPDGTSFH